MNFKWLLACALFMFINEEVLKAQCTELSGTIFNDLNGNGTFDAGEDGFSNAILEAFDDAGASYAATINADGTYTIAIPDPNALYRLELSGFPAWMEASFYGSSNGTSVQFIGAADCDADFGVLDPSALCDTDPDLITPCYVNGDPLAGGTAANMDVVVSYAYSSSGQTGTINHIASGYETGSVWGGAIQRETQSLFTGALMKRHVGLGSLGLGGIYITDFSGATPTNAPYVDLTTLGVDVGAALLTSRDLPADANQSSRDQQAFDLVGKVGFGGVALSDNSSKLWLMNLHTKEIVSVQIDNPAKPGTALTAADISSFVVPDPGCNLGEYRPFGLKYYQGKLYAGVVCTAENGGTRADLVAYVYEFDLTTLSFNSTPIFSFPLDYRKGWAHATALICEYWEPWTANFSDMTLGGSAGGGTRTCLPQPMLSDIEFTDDGDMVIGLMDRAGHQLGRLNLSTDATDMTLYNGYIGGDILRAENSTGSWVLESNGIVGGLVGCGSGNTQGPGGGEFYCGEFFNIGATSIHEETFQGGLLIVPGTGELLATLMDPFDVWSGGIGWLSNTDGNEIRAFQLYDTVDDGDVTFGKANGLGTIEVLCGAAPLEIGNVVWIDSDGDGVQDPSETFLDGVTINLYDENGNFIASTTTANGGEWYFNDTNVPGGLSNSTNYFVVMEDPNFDPATGQYSNGGTTYQLTSTDTGAGTNADLNDNDASIAGNGLGFDGYPVIPVTTGTAGENDHSLDIGLMEADCPEVNCLNVTIIGD